MENNFVGVVEGRDGCAILRVASVWKIHTLFYHDFVSITYTDKLLFNLQNW